MEGSLDVSVEPFYCSVETAVKGSLEVSVEPFYHYICLWMVGCCVMKFSSQYRRMESCDQCELGFPVRCYMLRSANLGDPVLQRGACKGERRRVGNRNGFRPPCESVDDGEAMQESLRRW